MERRQTFNAVAGLYAAVRPSYPDALFRDLAELAGLNGSAVVLEVGCGAGQATQELAARARHVVAVDPGADLLREAAARVQTDNVSFVEGLFEDYDMSPGIFTLVASAQAWHWISPEIGFRKAASALVDGGSLAIFGHVPMPVEEPFAALFEPLFQAHAPGFWGSPPPQAAYLPGGPFPRLFEASKLFCPVIHRRYLWRWSMSSQILHQYLKTDSTYHDLPEDRRHDLFTGMRDAVVSQGDRLDAPWETHLYLAVKR